MHTKESPHKAGKNERGYAGNNDSASEAEQQPVATISTPSAKELRLLDLLIERPDGFTRREAEPVVGVSYLPNPIKALRDRFGIKIECSIETGLDRDGRACHWGRYHAGPEARARARQLLGA